MGCFLVTFDKNTSIALVQPPIPLTDTVPQSGGEGHVVERVPSGRAVYVEAGRVELPVVRAPYLRWIDERQVLYQSLRHKSISPFPTPENVV